MKTAEDLTTFAREKLIDAEFSISKQIWTLLFDDAIFRPFRQLKIESERRNLETGLCSPFLIRLANLGYLATVTFGIMRLCDERRNNICLPAILHRLDRFATRGAINKSIVKAWWKEYRNIPIKNLKTYRDKHFAHQDNHYPSSEFDLDISSIDECEKQIVILVHSMTTTLLNDPAIALADPDPINWKHRNSPLVPEVLNARMNEIWDERQREVWEWVQPP